MAGKRREKKLAAIMIPAAAPVSTVRKLSLSFFEKNTKSAPSVVMAHMNSDAISACKSGLAVINHCIRKTLPKPRRKGIPRRSHCILCARTRFGCAKPGPARAFRTKSAANFFHENFISDIDICTFKYYNRKK